MSVRSVLSSLKKIFSALQKNTNVGSYVYQGINETDAFGSPGGRWEPNEFPAFQFSKDNKTFLIRFIPDYEKLVIEAVHLSNMLINYLLNGDNCKEENGNLVLLDNYVMTVRHRRSYDEVKEAMQKVGMSNNTILKTTLTNIDANQIVNSLLQWADYRAKAKELIRYQTSEISNIVNNTDNIPKKEFMQHSLNQILYGPPGTGKTYNTINKAVSIANPLFDIEYSTREQLKQEYDRLVKEGVIEFTTFHQSMSYEDFIEGIKPVEPQQTDTYLKYEIKDGIFKRLVERASKVSETKSVTFSISEAEFDKASFYKISLGDSTNADDDQIYNWCIANGYIALGWGDAIDFTGKQERDIQQMVPTQLEKFAAQAVNYFTHYVKVGDYVVVTLGNLQFRAIGKVVGNYEFKNIDGLYTHQFRKVEWLLKNVELPYETLYAKQFSQQSIYRLDKREIKKEFFVESENAKQNLDSIFKSLAERIAASKSDELLIKMKTSTFYITKVDFSAKQIVGIRKTDNKVYKFDFLEIITDIKNILNQKESLASKKLSKAEYGFTLEYIISNIIGNNLDTIKKYVLIIDEINRGNISQIFGELITLIEEDKRLGQPEALSCVLPYSKKSFSVPSNLHIIGTMNTADRSVEALDTALRRRFVFEEMMPKANFIIEAFLSHFESICNSPEFIQIQWADKIWKEKELEFKDFISVEDYEKVIDTYDVSDNKIEFIDSLFDIDTEQFKINLTTATILNTVNERIALLLSRDHLIGHSYFIGKYTWSSLQHSFHKNIIPLLQEYFYGDYGKIGLVLGDGFFALIDDSNNNNKSPFAKFGNYETAPFLEKPKYILKDVGKMEVEDFKAAINTLLQSA